MYQELASKAPKISQQIEKFGEKKKKLAKQIPNEPTRESERLLNQWKCNY
jgi:hypothetical protein